MAKVGDFTGVLASNFEEAKSVFFTFFIVSFFIATRVDVLAFFAFVGADVADIDGNLTLGLATEDLLVVGGLLWVVFFARTGANFSLATGSADLMVLAIGAAAFEDGFTVFWGEFFVFNLVATLTCLAAVITDLAAAGLAAGARALVGLLSEAIFVLAWLVLTFATGAAEPEGIDFANKGLFRAAATESGNDFFFVMTVFAVWAADCLSG